MTDLITLDFETFYDRDFSLSKMTTEEYIRDPRFETIGVSVKVNEGNPQWYSGTKAQIKRALDQYDWDSCVAIAHHAMFDMAILNWHFDIRPKRIADTLSMLRAIDGPDAGNSLAKAAERYGLGAKGDEVINALGKRRIDFSPAELKRYALYCCNDGELTYKLFEILAPLLPALELRLIDLTIRMFTEPVLTLDTDILTTHLTDVQAKKEALLEVIDADKSVLMSNPQLAQLLESKGVTPPTKISPATGKATWAFGKNDEGFKALLEHSDLTVQAIVAARMGVKSTLEETRTERFIRIAERGTLPVPLRYYAAHTGRWGGDDKINLQNIPRKSPLKKAIKAPEGYTLIDCDSSQIEARTLAWLAGQDDLVAAFDRGEDVYRIMASAIYAVPVDEVTADQRFVGKTTILGCLAEGTLVLTDRGWVAIEGVNTSDQLWDGEGWVCHQGLVRKGIKETFNLCGLWLTPDHKVLCGTQWLEAQSVAQDRNTLSLALDTGAASWLYPDISDLSPEQRIVLTEERSVYSRRNLMTYDIAYAGPRNRYTVATDAGPIIVHNCGYGMGAVKFQAQLKTFNVDMPLGECKRIIRVYRETYPKIPELWAAANTALEALIRQSTAPLGRDGVLTVDLLGIRLPNDMYIRYPNLRKEANTSTGYDELLYDTKKGRSTIPTRIYGGKCVENICQALARIIIGEQMLMVARRYRVVMTVHDAVGSLAKDAEAGVAQKFVEQCMRIQPKWAVGLPLNCESKKGKSYGG